MRKVSQIDIREVLKRYFGYKDTDFQLEVSTHGKKIYKTKCPIHKESDPSFKIYDKNGVYDCICFSKRDAGNNAIQLLVIAGKAKDAKDAEAILKKDFNITPPDTMNIKGLAEYKGFTEAFLISRGMTDDDAGVVMPFHRVDGTVMATKLRRTYEKVEGQAKFTWKTQDADWSNPYYGMDLVGNDTSRLVLDVLEGETDALTMQMMGFTAIGIVGADTYRSEHSSFMRSFTKVIVTKDNDEAGTKLAMTIAKDNEENTFIRLLPKGVKDVNSLFVDTCTEDSERFKAYMAKLPVVPASKKAFMNELGRNSQYAYDEHAVGFLLSIMSDVEAEIFKSEIKETKGVAKRAVDKLFKACLGDNAIASYNPSQSGVQEFDNCYVKYVKSERGVKEVSLSNFVLQPVAYFHMPDGRNREFVLACKSGYVSEPVMFRAEELTNLNLFKKRCFEVGDFVFNGSSEDFSQVMLFILENSDDVMDITLPATVGRQENFWLFGNVLVKDGEYYSPDDDRNFKVGGTTYRARSVYNDNSAKNIPMLDLKSHLEREKQLEAIHLLHDSYGNPDVIEALGWMIASVFSEKVVDAHNGFPLLFITGRSGSGKSTLARNLNCAMNIHNTRADSFNSSIVGMTRMMGYYSNIPVWYDEYRENDRNIQYKTQFLKEAFERQGVSKGVKVGAVVQRTDLFSTLILSGEDAPEDRGLMSRCFIVKLDRHTNSQASYHEFKQYEDEVFNVIGREAVRMSTINGNYREFHKLLNNRRKELICIGADDRTAFIRATTYAGIVWLFPELDDIVKENQVESVKASLADVEEADPVRVMMQDMLIMLQSGHMLAGRDFRLCPSGIFFNSFRQFYNVWASYLAISRTRPPHSLSTMKEYVLKSGILDYKTVRFDKHDTPKGYILPIYNLESPTLKTYVVDAMFKAEQITLQERRDILDAGDDEIESEF